MIDYDENGEDNVETQIPWTSIKDIMKGIVKYSGVEIDGNV